MPEPRLLVLWRKMRFQWKSSLLLIVAALCMAQESMVPPAVRRVGEKLSCLCGACKNTVGTCDMMGCHYTAPKREQIAGMLAKGVSDESIVAAIVKEVGLQALAEPPQQGFNSMALLMPFVMIALGLSGIYLFIQKNRRQPAVVDALHPEVLDRFHAAAEKEFEKLD